MSQGWKHIKAIAFICIFLAAGVRPGAGQVVRPGARQANPLRAPAVGTVPVPPIGNVMSMALADAGIDFSFISGSASNPGNSPLTVTLTWNCRCVTVALYAYFSSATVALTDGAGDNIPSAAFSLSDNGGPFRVLNTTVPFGGANAGLRVFSITNPPRSGSHPDTLNFNVDLSTGTLPKLPPGTYTGTLTLQGQAQ